MKNWIRDMVRKAFDVDELEEMMQEAIAESIDYKEIAESILEDFDVTEIAKEVAEEEI